MAIRITFNNRDVFEPGVYAQTRSGIPPIPVAAASGKLMIIDTGTGASFGGGAGINGELQQRRDTIYEADDIDAFRRFIRGGLWWDLSDYLYNPDPKLNAPGVESLQYVRAATTRAANLVYAFSGGSGSGARASAYIGVVSATIATPGSSYTDGVYVDLPIVGGVLKDGTGNEATLDITVAGGVVTVVTINAPGAYKAAPTGSVTVVGLPGGAGATFALSFGLTEIDILNGGLNYGVAPTIELIGTSNVPATATAALTLGAVTSTTIGVAGSGYLFAPIVLFVVSTANGGVIEIKTRTEGETANGVLSGANVTRGYATKISTGIVDPTKFVLEFWTGTFKGLDSNNIPYELPEADSLGQLMIRSAEFSNIDELVKWMENDFYFKRDFVLHRFRKFGNGNITQADISGNAGFNLASGGSESFSPSDLDAVLEAIVEEDNTYFLCDKWGDNATAVSNVKILTHIQNDAEYEKFMWVGGGFDVTKLEGTGGSVNIAQFYDSDRVLVVHSGVRVPTATGERTLDSIYHTAIVAGRTAGLAAQVPSTWKSLRITGVVHDCNRQERKKLLNAGVIHAKYVDNEWVINQTVNTLQDNATLFVNGQEKSHIHQIGRIAAQLNKELVIEARTARDADGNRAFIGGNRNTASAVDIQQFVIGRLQDRTARPSADNLIISFKNVKVSSTPDGWDISYSFTPNGEVNKLFITGFILDFNVSI